MFRNPKKYDPKYKTKYIFILRKMDYVFKTLRYHIDYLSSIYFYVNLTINRIKQDYAP